MKCKHCNTENNENQRFCRKCGSPLHEDESFLSSKEARERIKSGLKKKESPSFLKKYGVSLTVGVIAAVLIVGTGIYLFVSESPKAEDSVMYTERDLIEKASTFYDLGDVDGAIEICQQMLMQDPENEQVKGLLTYLQAEEIETDNPNQEDEQENPFLTYTPSSDTRKYAVDHYEIEPDNTEVTVDSYIRAQNWDDSQASFSLNPDSSTTEQKSETDPETVKSSSSTAAAVPESEPELNQEQKSSQDLQEEDTDKEKTVSTESEKTISDDKEEKSSLSLELKRDIWEKETLQSIKNEEENQDKSSDSQEKENEKTKTVEKEEESSKEDEENKSAQTASKRQAVKKDTSSKEETVKSVPNVLDRSVLILGPGESYTFNHPSLSKLSLSTPANQTLTKSGDPKTLIEIEGETITNIANSKVKEDSLLIKAAEDGNNDECLVLVTDQKKADQANGQKLVLILNENQVAGIKNEPKQEISIKTNTKSVVFRADDLTSDTEDQTFTWKIAKEGKNNQSKIVPEKNLCTFYPGNTPAKTTLTATNSKGEKVEVLINIQSAS